jgi:recombination protein RecA
MAKTKTVDDIANESAEWITDFNKRSPNSVGLAHDILNIRKDADLAIPTGLLGLDFQLGRLGGVPRGAFTQIYGNKSAGKSTLGYYIVAQAQKLGLLCGWIDPEATFDKAFAEICGVDLKKLMYVLPDDAEEAISADRDLIDSGYDVISLDSLGALVTAKEIEADPEKSLPAARARMIKKYFLTTNMAGYKANVAHIFINQLVGNMKTDSYGNPIKIPAGGEAPQYFSSCTISMKAGQREIEDGKVAGMLSTITVEKNKKDVPGGKTEVYFDAGLGFNRVQSAISAAIEIGVVRQAGAWLYVGEDKFNGMNKFVEAVTNDTALGRRLVSATRVAMKSYFSTQDARLNTERAKIDSIFEAV